MKILRSLWILPGLAALAACGSDSTTSVHEPLAYVRYVYAVPDTFAVNVNAVDRVENLNFADPNSGLTTYQWVSPYEGIVAGSRHFKVFLNPGGTNPDITVVSTVLVDTTIALAANSYYTILHTGFARAGQTPKQRWIVTQDNVPAPTSTQIAIRAVVTNPGIGPVDVYAPTDTKSSTPSSATFTNVAYGSPAAWVTLTPKALALRVFASGTTTPTLAELNAPAGSPQQTYLDPVAGTTVGGTALTAFIFPAGVAGSPSASAKAKITYSVDRRPPRS